MEDGPIDKQYVALRVQTALSCWRKLIGVLYDMRMPKKLKTKVYEVPITSALTYGSECWAMKTNNMRTIAACSGKKK